MSYFFLNRLVSFSVVSGFSLGVHRKLMFSIFYAVLFGHYMVQIIYSKKQRAALKNSPDPKIWFLVLALIAVAQFTPYLPISVFFGFHFIFSEIYTERFADHDPAIKWFRILTNFSIYSLLLHGAPAIGWIPFSFLYLCLMVGCIGLLYLALRARNDSELWFLLGYELVGAAFAIFLPPNRPQLSDIIFYHLIWWFIFPLRRMRGKELFSYLFLTVSITGVFFLFTPSANVKPIPLSVLGYYSIVSGNIHIALSFMLSISNPEWINRIFHPHLKFSKPVPLSELS